MCCASHQVEVAHSLSDFRASGPQRVSGVPKKRVFGFQRATNPNTCPSVLPRSWPDSQKMCLKEVGMEIVACHDASCAIGGRQIVSMSVIKFRSQNVVGADLQCVSPPHQQMNFLGPCPSQSPSRLSPRLKPPPVAFHLSFPDFPPSQEVVQRNIEEVVQRNIDFDFHSCGQCCQCFNFKKRRNK